jgi:hypothetical protein
MAPVSQFLLLLEIILLVATAYIYWLTRQLLIEQQATPTDLPQSGSKGDSEATAIVKHVTDLLTDVESTVSTVRNDLIRQSAYLQETINRAETTREELEALLDQAKAQHYSSQTEEVTAITPPIKMPKDISIALTLASALNDFGKYLQTSGRSENTINSMLSHVRGFVTWLGGQCCEEIPLRRINPTEIETYFDYLSNQNYQLGTLKRKRTVLRTFIVWLNDLVADEPLNADTEVMMTLPASQDTGLGKLGSNRKKDIFPQCDSAPHHYQQVFALANQGLDQSAIAAKTGLEQEAIRILLTVGPPQLNH